MKSDMKSLLLSSIAGIVVGYLSFLFVSPWIALVLVVVFAFVLNFAAAKWIAKDIAPEKRGFKWWLVNGGMSYFIVWFVVWVLALNLMPPAA